MHIPDQLVNEIKAGNVVVILGSGASLSAQDPNGNHPPSGRQLADSLSDRFLGGKHKDKPLNEVSDYAINEGGLYVVQDYIKHMFDVFQPSSAHLAMTRIVWRGIATTNYDRLIERAYETAPDALQKPQPFIRDNEIIDHAMRSKKSIVLLKLHGCITLTSEGSCPLILTPEQYLEHEKGRRRLFGTLKEWAYEHPLLFIGHGLQDPDLRYLLLKLRQEMDNFLPRCYAIMPECDEIQVSTWEKRNVSLLRCSFNDFMESLDKQLPQQLRQLATYRQKLPSTIVSRFIDVNRTMSESCQQFVDNDVDYVNDIRPTMSVDPHDFYRGFNPGWPAIAQGLDVRRIAFDTIMADRFLIEKSEHLKRMEVIMIKAHAGAGKSVSLRRLAWDVAHDYGYLCLYLKDNGMIDVAALREIISLCKERVYLFVDDAADRLRELQNLSKKIGPDGSLLTVVAAERINEWNAADVQVDTLIDWEYNLEYLKPKEITALLVLLEKYRALGTLEKLGDDQRVEALSKRAGRQLLVALHEATLGRPFEDIVEDEYRNIIPFEAQQIYLTICVLNRLNIRVRAGIISRLYGVPFNQFESRFSRPLEHVVFTQLDQQLNDYYYQARHPHIAEMVFDRILSDAETRYDAYMKCLSVLNLNYSDDLHAYRMMVRGRTLLELFPNNEMVKEILNLAKTRMGTDAYLLHQMAIYEMARPNGNLHEAGDLLVEADRIAAPDHQIAIKHSMAERHLKLAEVARTPLERTVNLNHAGRIADTLKKESKDDEYGYHTQIKVELIKLSDVLAGSTDDVPSNDLIEIVKNVESSITKALQRFPGSPYILTAQAQFADMLYNAVLAQEALEKAFVANPRSTYMASRLSAMYIENDNIPKAVETLETALSVNSGDKNLHYRYAKLLIRSNPTNGDLIAYHLHRAYTQGDTNYDAQLLHGRQLFVNGNLVESRTIFSELEKAKIGPELRSKVQYPLEEKFSGQITKLEAFYGFIMRDGAKDKVFMSPNSVSDEVWDDLGLGARVHFSIGFNVRGPIAFDVKPQ
ncbi:MAG: P-loop NTPase [Armatimonadota bacterium]